MKKAKKWSKGKTAKYQMGFYTPHAQGIRIAEADKRDAFNDIRRLEREAEKNKKDAIKQFKL